MAKTVNIIYLDLSLNASAGALSGALVQLAEVMPDLKQAIAQLRIPDVVISMVPSTSDRVVGHSLVLTNELGQPMDAKGAFTVTQNRPSTPRLPQWDKNEASNLAATTSGNSSGTQTQQQLKLDKGPPKNQRSVWHNPSMTFLDIKNWLRSTSLDAMVQTMCLRVFRTTIRSFRTEEPGAC